MTTGHMDYLTGILRRLVFRITELLEIEPTEGEEDRAPTSSWAYDHEHDIIGKYGCRVYCSGTFNVAHMEDKLIPFDRADYDIGGEFNLSTYIYTAKYAGKYLAILNARSDSTVESIMEGYFLKNAAYEHSCLIAPDVQISRGSLSMACIIDLAVDDTLKGYIYQEDQAGTDLIRIMSNRVYTFMCIQRLA